MPDVQPHAAAPEPAIATANDRFKQGFSRWFWGGLVLATLAHAGLFAASPTFALDPAQRDVSVLDVYDIPEVEMPPEPEPIQRPARPAIADVEMDDDITIAPTRLEDHPPETLNPPPAAAEAVEDPVPFTPMTVRPRLTNEAEIARALVRLYPPLLRDAGVGGTAVVWVHIDEEGRVVETRLNESSGYDDLDQAAIRVADRMRFTPALNRDRRVPVWIAVPIRFETQ